MLEMGAKLGDRVVEPDWAECYFCDRRDVQDSKEHIFPQWLLKAEGVAGEIFEPMYFSSPSTLLAKESSKPTHTRPKAPAQHFVAKNVCPHCNGGWMSAIETDYKAFYEGLPGSHFGSVARWFIKTAFVLAVSQNRRLQLPRETRLELAAGVVPNRVSVYFHEEIVTDPDRGIFDFAQSAQIPPMIVESKSVEAAAESIRELWACSIRVKNLVGTVVLSPEGEVWASSWESRGAPAVIAGELRPEPDLEHLPRLTQYSHGVCLVPVRTEWHNAFGTSIREIASWPAGVYGIGEVRSYVEHYSVAHASERRTQLRVVSNGGTTLLTGGGPEGLQ
jgi:hypothetical protein